MSVESSTKKHLPAYANYIRHQCPELALDDLEVSAALLSAISESDDEKPKDGLRAKGWLKRALWKMAANKRVATHGTFEPGLTQEMVLGGLSMLDRQYAWAGMPDEDFRSKRRTIPQRMLRTFGAWYFRTDAEKKAATEEAVREWNSMGRIV